MTTSTTPTIAPDPGAERRIPPLGGFNVTFLGLEIRRALRNRRTVVFMVVLPVVIYASFGRATGVVPDTDVAYRAYEMVSLALYGAMLACTSAGSMVAVERAQGWSRQLRLTPLRPPAYIAMKLATALSLGLVPVALLFIFGSARGVTMSTGTWILSGVATWLSAIIFAALGLFMGYLLPSENVMQFLGPILGILSIFGGVIIPISLLGQGLQTFAKFTPVWGVAELAHAPLVGQGVSVAAWANIVIWLVIFSGGAMMLFRRDTRRV